MINAPLANAGQHVAMMIVPSSALSATFTRMPERGGPHRMAGSRVRIDPIRSQKHLEQGGTGQCGMRALRPVAARRIPFLPAPIGSTTIMPPLGDRLARR